MMCSDALVLRCSRGCINLDVSVADNKLFKQLRNIGCLTLLGTSNINALTF